MVWRSARARLQKGVALLARAAALRALARRLAPHAAAERELREAELHVERRAYLAQAYPGPERAAALTRARGRLALARERLATFREPRP